jgi:hypothetical protein
MTITIFNQSIIFFYIFTIIPYNSEMAAQTSGDFGGFNIFANPATHLCLFFRKKVTTPTHRPSNREKRW